MLENTLPPSLREAAKRHALSHAILFSGPGDREGAARWTAAAMECQAPDRDPPCGRCPACHKVLAGIHPDVVTVRDPDHEKISVDIIRESVRSDAYLRPNEGGRKIYIFPDCALLPERDQNVLLKIVEEGPPYAAFLFCAENPSAVLRTLRSRCVEVKLAERGSGEAEDPGAVLGAALCRGLGKKGAAAELLMGLDARKKKPERGELAEALAWSRRACTSALRMLYGGSVEERDREIASFLAKTLTKGQIMSTIEVLEMYYGQCAYNVGLGHLLGGLAAELEGIH